MILCVSMLFLPYQCVTKIGRRGRGCLLFHSRTPNIITKMSKLYKLDPSPPARAAMMASEIFGVPVEMVDVSLINKEHLTPEFKKINPLHTIPVFKDGDLVIHDSNAILMYWADNYGKNDSWYPKDLKKRALVNQKVLFNATILQQRLRNVTVAAMLHGERIVPQQKLNDIKEAYEFMEEFLKNTKYLAGNEITIADIAVYATVTALVHIVPLDTQKYPKLAAWLKNLEVQPYSQKYNAPGDKTLGELIKKSIDF